MNDMSDTFDFDPPPEKEKDRRPDNCAGCGYRPKTMECRRHSPHPNQDEEFKIAVWNYTKDHNKCGAGSVLKTIVQCNDCVHWDQPNGQHLWPDYRMGLPDEWWQQSGLCTSGAPGATTEEGMLTFWPVTSTYQLSPKERKSFAPPTVGGCGDGISITEMRKAAEEKAARKASADAKKAKRMPLAISSI